MMYAILPKKYVNTDNGKDCHVFEAEVDKEYKSYINIKNSVFSSHTAIKNLFTGFKIYNLNCGNKIYEYSKNEDNVYYVNKDAIRIIAAHILKEKMCGQCIATLY